MSPGKAEIVRMAFASWQEVSGLRFTETTGKADILIKKDITHAQNYVKENDPGVIDHSVVNILDQYEGIL